jgi:ATPase subunit of ABC transporter with duplicated ATPase domains
MSSRISLTGSALSYEFSNGTSLFRKLNFSFGQSTYGLIGPNGVGKTTLVKLLCREIPPTSGTVSCNGSLAVLPQIRNRSDENSTQVSIAEMLGIQNTIEALKQVESGHASPEVLDLIGDHWDLETQIEKTFQSLGIGYLTTAQSSQLLSGGEWVKIHLAKILLNSPSIVLLDEPSNNLDESGRQVLYHFIENWKRCLIVVSHDRALLSHVQTIVELSNHGLQFYGGNYDFYVSEREKENNALQQQLTTAKQERKRQQFDLQKSLERQQKRMSQGKRAAAQGGIPTIAAGGLKRKAQGTLARIKDVQESRLIDSQIETQTLKSKIKARNIIQIDTPETSLHSKKEILVIEDFNFKQSASQDFLYSHPISFRLAGPKRVRITGPNGAGKSTLIRLLLQSVADTKDSLSDECTGVIQLKTNRVAYLDQNLSLLGEGQDSLLVHFSKTTPHLSESERRIRLGRFLFNHSNQAKKISDLSGGERMRAALACILFSEFPPELLILDEPTNNLDMDSIEQIESALSQFKGAVIVISHDSEFLTNIGATEELAIPHRFRLNVQTQ